MNIELKKIMPYVPYKLKIWDSPDEESINICELLSVDRNGVYELKEINHNDVYSVDPIIWANVKPILRPLSFLTKEIEVNGQLIVPIVELAKIEEGTINDHITGNIIEIGIIGCKNETYYVKYLVETTNMGDLIYYFGYWSHLNRFAKKDITTNSVKGTSFQLDLFSKLFEWHFDVFGLIEQKLAVDYFSVFNKP
jgi:hypothetical protein